MSTLTARAKFQVPKGFKLLDDGWEQYGDWQLCSTNGGLEWRLNPRTGNEGVESIVVGYAIRPIKRKTKS